MDQRLEDEDPRDADRMTSSCLATEPARTTIRSAICFRRPLRSPDRLLEEIKGVLGEDPPVLVQPRVKQGSPAKVLIEESAETQLGQLPTYVARCSPVRVERAATRSPGVPSKMIRPPSWPAPGPRSMIQSALAITA